MDIAVITGLLGLIATIAAALLGYFRGLKANVEEFSRVEEYRDKQKKRDALRDVLGDVIPDMRAILNRAANEPRESLRQEAKKLHKRVEVVCLLFYNDSNEKVKDALTATGNLVGSVISPQYSLTRQDFVVFEDDVKILKDKLAALDESLSKGIK